MYLAQTPWSRILLMSLNLTNKKQTNILLFYFFKSFVTLKGMNSKYGKIYIVLIITAKE